MTITLPEVDFAPAAVWCCRCKGTKPLTQRNCTNEIHKTDVVEYEKGGETRYKTIELPEMTDCAARTCEKCMFIDGLDKSLRYPIQVPTKWACGICAEDKLKLGWKLMGRHVLDILRGKVWCDCMKKSTVVVYNKKGRGSKRFGKLMAVPPHDFNLRTEPVEAVSFLWGLGASYWVPEIEKPGTLLEPEKPPGPSVAEVLGLTPLPESESITPLPESKSKSESIAPLPESKSKSTTFTGVLRKGFRKMKPKPQVELTPEQKAAKEAEEEAAFQRLLEKGNQELERAAADVADRKAKFSAVKAKQALCATDDKAEAPDIAAADVEAESEHPDEKEEKDGPKSARKLKKPRPLPKKQTPEEAAAKEAEEEAAFQKMLEKGNEEMAKAAAEAAEIKAKAALKKKKKKSATDDQTKAPDIAADEGSVIADTVAEPQLSDQEKEKDAAPPERARKMKRKPPPKLTPEEAAAKGAEEEAAFQRMLEKGNEEMAKAAAEAAEMKAKAAKAKAALKKAAGTADTQA